MAVEKERDKGTRKEKESERRKREREMKVGLDLTGTYAGSHKKSPSDPKCCPECMLVLVHFHSINYMFDGRNRVLG